MGAAQEDKGTAISGRTRALFFYEVFLLFLFHPVPIKPLETNLRDICQTPFWCLMRPRNPCPQTQKQQPKAQNTSGRFVRNVWHTEAVPRIPWAQSVKNLVQATVHPYHSHKNHILQVYITEKVKQQKPGSKAMVCIISSFKISLSFFTTLVSCGIEHTCI